MLEKKVRGNQACNESNALRDYEISVLVLLGRSYLGYCE